MASLNKTVTERRNNLICEICGSRNKAVKKVWCRCGFCQDQICLNCESKRRKCPRCEVLESTNHYELTENFAYMNSLNLDYLHNQRLKIGLRFFCVNKENGCQEKLSSWKSLSSCEILSLRNHEKECIYRSVPCIFSAIDDKYDCEAEVKVTFQNVIRHYEEEHANGKLKNQVLMAKNHLILNERSTFSHPITFSLNNQTFLLVQKTSNQITYYWVYLLGSPEEAKDLSYILRFFGKDSDIVFRGKVAAIDETFEIIDEAGKCFTIPHKTFMNQFVDESRKCEYSLSILNLGEMPNNVVSLSGF